MCFYRVSTGAIVLLCKECSSIWLRPDNTGWGDSVNGKALCEHFAVDHQHRLFDSGGANWATYHQVVNDPLWDGALGRVGRIRRH